MGALKVDDWKWNIWEMDSKTGKLKRWIGSITDPKTGFEWLKKQGKDAKKFKINNVPPSTSTMQNPAYEVYAESDLSLHQGDDMPQKHIPGKYDDFTPREKRKTLKETLTKAPKSGTARVVAVPQAPKPKDTKEMKKIKADAAALLNQHKADEKAEMDAADKD